MQELIDSDDLRLLADIGFIAVSRGLMSHAEAIFTGLDAMRRDSEAAATGLALVEIAMGKPDRAAARLERAPDTPGVRAFRGLALMQSGDRETAGAVLDALLQETPDDPAAEIGRTLRAESAGDSKLDPATLYSKPPARP